LSDTVTIGRIVHYVLESDTPDPDNPDRPQIVHRAAIVIHVYDTGEDLEQAREEDLEQPFVDLESFTRGRHDGPINRFIERAAYDEEGTLGTWHWPERSGTEPVKPKPVAAEKKAGRKRNKKAAEAGDEPAAMSTTTTKSEEEPGDEGK